MKKTLYRISIEDFGIYEDRDDLTKKAREIIMTSIPRVGDVIQLPGWQVRVKWIELYSIADGEERFRNQENEINFSYDAGIGVEPNFVYRDKELPFRFLVELVEASVVAYPEMVEQIKIWEYEDTLVPRIGEQIRHPVTNKLFRVVDSILSPANGYAAVLQVAYEGRSWTPLNRRFDS